MVLTPLKVAFQQFLDSNKLPQSYIEIAKRYFDPIASEIANNFLRTEITQVIGINGSQGSGKSTLADYLCMSIKQNFEIRTISLSLDDFYLTKEERNQLAKNIHPLLAQRGVPGTHDIELAVNTIKSLALGIKTKITRFDKSIDDRISNQVEISEGEIGVIVIEGWCFGAEPQFENQLITPVNELERLKDPDGTCRRYINNALATSYPKLFKMAHSTIMLRAPDFDSVFEWRLEQEEKLIEKLKLTQDGLVGMSVMSKEEIFEFIQSFQRITETCIERIPAKVNHLLQLDPQREIIEYRTLNP